MVKKTLVLGASLKPERYSNIAIRKLNIKRNEVLAIGLKATVEIGRASCRERV